MRFWLEFLSICSIVNIKWNIGALLYVVCCMLYVFVMLCCMLYVYVNKMILHNMAQDGVVQWAELWTRNRSVVSSITIKGSRCFHSLHCLVLVNSSDRFERDSHKQTRLVQNIQRISTIKVNHDTLTYMFQADIVSWTLSKPFSKTIILIRPL